MTEQLPDIAHSTWHAAIAIVPVATVGDQACRRNGIQPHVICASETISYVEEEEEGEQAVKAFVSCAGDSSSVMR